MKTNIKEAENLGPGICLREHRTEPQFTYEAWVWDSTTRKKIRRSFPTHLEARQWRLSALEVLREKRREQRWTQILAPQLVPCRPSQLPRTNSRAKAELGPQIGIRTSNDAEIAVCAALERDGWTVMKRGWPDFLAVRGDEVRLIEVKPSRSCHLKPAQRRVAHVLARFGLRVEMLTPEDVA